MDESPQTSHRALPAPFWPRVRRATTILLAGAAVHMWVVRAPESTGSSPARPGAWVNMVAEAEPVPAATSGTAPVRSDAVTLDVVVIEVPVVDTAPAAEPAAVPSTKARASDPPPEPARGGHSAAGDLARHEPQREGLQPVATTGDGGIDPADIVSAREPAPSTASRFPEVTGPPLAARSRSGAPANASGPAADETPALHAPSVLPGRALTLNGARPPAATPSSTPVEVADGLDHEQLVRALLYEYRDAYERLDVRAAKAVWPSLDARALERAFQQLERQRVRFASCEISLSGREANAHCRGDYAYTPRVGNRREQLVPREWTFSLARPDDRWQIVNVPGFH